MITIPWSITESSARDSAVGQACSGRRTSATPLRQKHAMSNVRADGPDGAVTTMALSRPRLCTFTSDPDRRLETISIIRFHHVVDDCARLQSSPPSHPLHSSRRHDVSGRQLSQGAEPPMSSNSLEPKASASAAAVRVGGRPSGWTPSAVALGRDMRSVGASQAPTADTPSTRTRAARIRPRPVLPPAETPSLPRNRAQRRSPRRATRTHKERKCPWFQK